MLGGPGVMMIGVGDSSMTRQKVRPGTFRRILPYLKRYRWGLAFLLIVTSLLACSAPAQWGLTEVMGAMVRKCTSGTPTAVGVLS